MVYLIASVWALAIAWAVRALVRAMHEHEGGEYRVEHVARYHVDPLPREKTRIVDLPMPRNRAEYRAFAARAKAEARKGRKVRAVRR